MSHKTTTLTLDPPKGQDSEVIEMRNISCPVCNGKGGQDCGGWLAKFKSSMDDDDWQTCLKCGGTGRLKAKVVIKWEAEEPLT